MSQQNQYNKEAKQKIKELAENIDFCIFLTRLKVTPLNAAPMSTKRVDEQGVIWFLSNSAHDTVMNIDKDAQVQLCYGKPGSMEFLSVFGEARIVTDSLILNELYGKIDDTWFEGADDPNLRALAVTPKEARYWEPKNNKVVTLLKMAYSSLTGNSVNLGKEGRLKP